ncbi:unnamed protein product, partial [Medioppia subpectinata]
MCVKIEFCQNRIL